MANIHNFLFLIALFSILANIINPCLAFQEDRKVYIVYMGALPNLHEDQYSPQAHHNKILQNVLQGSVPADCLVHSYKRSFNGFAAALTNEEQQKIARMEGVVSVFPSTIYELHTTRSWDFIGFPETVKRMPVKESDVIVGILDSGVWPESESFSDEGFGPPPKKWKGVCQTDGNFNCNNKLIGARYYEQLLPKEEHTPRDVLGHGTHTASTVAGREVKGVSLFGIAEGNARGAVPSARIAMYKVCTLNGCSDESILAAFDDAIADGVDILSISLGPNLTFKYSEDTLAIGAFHAMVKGILTSHSAGNSGPQPQTLKSVAPWTFTVAASSIDREIVTKVVTGNGTTILGRAINTFNSTETVPLILGANASSTCSSAEAGSCLAHCLDEQLVKGKIVFCDTVDTGGGPLLAGAMGQIVEDADANDHSSIFALPSTRLDLGNGDKIKSYIGSTKEPQAKILKAESILDLKAPVVASFSSRGPNPVSPDLLKPDITAPGVDIIAAFPPAASLTRTKQDKRFVKYNIKSGTSMACPHVAGAAAYVKTFHPEWSPAAIKSALMTTAFPMNASRNPEVEFAYGAGQIDPLKAVDPGLVYDTQEDDYIQLLCNVGYSEKEIELISGKKVACGNVTGTARHLNYPSMQLLVEANKSFSNNFTRSVTNVGSPISTYKATVSEDPQLQVTINPNVISFKSLNEKQSFIVTVAGKGLPVTSVLSTSLVWSDGVHNVRSPIVLYTSINA
ncbi:subtilisin-like protein protease SBT4.3 isoform X1 [Cinnamomum micranthum f. kanehirae]|uniref:Subtilisin-like protein protease SBT4.3 isoform X1 n=1 Tax=Cinnamomum micranthum f. kanehirae TaxID=337451 RepID=A0A443NBW0_9MAGN|nr:subtilisin-like protein protease SBT4.3 isoform X1 [Cinnamomum micranthum f. kanehirae]